MSQKTPENYNLTIKQFNFVMAFCHGLPDCPDAKGVASKSLSVAYDTSNYTKNSLYVQACKMMDLPKVVLAIQSEHRKEQKKHSLSAEQIRRKILSDLLSLSTSTNEHVQLKALEMLGKYQTVQAWGADKVETSQKVQIESSEEELMSAVATALNDERITALFNRDKKKN